MIDILDRVRSKQLQKKIMSAEEAALFIQPNQRVGVSGFTPAGYPKAVPLALAKRMQEEPFQIDLWSGASVGDELDGELTKVGGIRHRMPYQTNKEIQHSINTGKVSYMDWHLSHVAPQIRAGFFGSCDVAIVEAVAIREDGGIIPSMSLGNSATFVSQAKQVIVEINTTQPLALEGIHDVYEIKNPPHSEAIPLNHPADRIGTPYIPCDMDKIVAIVPCDIPDGTRAVAPIDEHAKAMSQHLIRFFSEEVEKGRLPKNLLPLQSGVGSVANAVVAGLVHGPFTNLTVYTEVIQDGMLDLLDSGKVDICSGTAITLSPHVVPRFHEKIEEYTSKIILRPQEISNHPAVVRRLGIIAMNTAIEFDIFGHVNSTHVMGSRMMNGIGGSGDFTRNGYITIFCTSSLAKGGRISSVVPMVSHVDHTEHDVHIFCTEQGIADVRGLDPVARAKAIIENCAHPKYRPLLRDYLQRAIAQNGQHIPMILSEALSWHERFLRTGDMYPSMEERVRIVRGRHKRSKQKSRKR